MQKSLAASSKPTTEGLKRDADGIIAGRTPRPRTLILTTIPGENGTEGFGKTQLKFPGTKGSLVLLTETKNGRDHRRKTGKVRGTKVTSKDSVQGRITLRVCSSTAAKGSLKFAESRLRGNFNNPTPFNNSNRRHRGEKAFTKARMREKRASAYKNGVARRNLLASSSVMARLAAGTS